MSEHLKSSKVCSEFGGFPAFTFILSESGVLMDPLFSGFATLGHDPSIISGKNFSEFLVHPDDRKAFDDAVKRALEQACETGINCRLLDSGGSWRKFFIIGCGVGLDGQQPCFFGTAGFPDHPDMHETVTSSSSVCPKTENSWKNEERFRSLVESSTDFVVRLSPELRFIYMNPAFFEETGASAERLVGKTLEEAGYGLPQTAFIIDRLGYAVLTGENLTLEISFDTKHGQRSFYTSLIPEKDEKKAVVSILTVTREITDIVKTRNDLERAERRFRDLLENIEDVVFTLDGKGSIRFISKAIEKGYGYRADEVIGRDFRTFIHPRDRENMEKMFSEALAGPTKPFEFRAYDKAGKVRKVRCAARPRTEDGVVNGVAGVITDFTDIQQNREALHWEIFVNDALNDLYSPLLQTGAVWDTVGKAVLDAALKISGSAEGCVALKEGLSGERVCRIFTKSSDGLCRATGKNTGDEADENTGNPCNRFWNCSIEEGVGFFTNNPKKHPAFIVETGENDTVPNRFLSVPVMILGGCVGRISVANSDRDYTERHLMALSRLADVCSLAFARLVSEESLRIGEQRARAMYENLPLPTLVWRRREKGFVLEDYNDAARALTNNKVTEMKGQSPQYLFKTDIDLTGIMQKCLEEGSTLRREFSFGFDGQVLYVAATWGFAPTDCVIMHLEDITEARKLREKMDASQRREHLGEMAGKIAHDFNNSLTIINSYLGLIMIEMREDDPWASKIIEIKKATDQAANLTRQLLAFASNRSLVGRVFSPNTVVREMKEILKMSIGENIKLSLRLEPDLGNVKADPGQLFQCINNLVANARDAMPKGGKIAISTKNLYLEDENESFALGIDPGHYVMIQVMDNGTGIPLEIQQKIFEIFFSTKAPGKGTGLGLSAVQNFFTGHGGNITVESEPGRGTTFSAYLPRSYEPAEAEAVGLPLPEKRVEGGGETILLVEDEQAVLNVTKQILIQAGFRVIAAADGEKAIELFEKRKEPVNLVLTDVRMPGMNGRELVDILRQKQPGLKAVFMSGFSSDVISSNGFLDQGIYFINKPYSIENMKRMLRQVLDDSPV